MFAGPNGAGKTTAAEVWLPELDVADFINADIIARDLGLPFTGVGARRAGRLALKRIDDLRKGRVDFAFETTLAGGGMEKRLLKLVSAGYALSVLYLALPSADHAVKRVQQRAARGGHPVPETDVRRRFASSRANFLRLRHLFAGWRVYDARGYTTGGQVPLIAAGRGMDVSEVGDRITWDRFSGGQDFGRKVNRGT